MKNLFVSILTVGLVTSASATTVVTWGGDYVAASQNLSVTTAANSNVNFGGTVATDRRFGTVVSGVLTNTMQPASGYSGSNGTFYGGYESINIDSASGASIGQSRIRDTGTLDQLQVQMVGSGASASGVAVDQLLLWKQADFLNGLNTGSLGFDGTSSLSLRFGPNASFVAGGSARWLVEDSGGFWLSSSSLTRAANTTTTLSNPESTTWAPISISGSYLNLDIAGATFGAHTFSGITAVGAYFEHDTLTSANAGSEIWSVEAFSASAVAVPEPSSWALLGLSLTMLTVFRRRLSVL